MTERLERAKTFSDIASVWIGLLAAIVAGVFALVQYFQKEQDDRVKTSLAFLQRYGEAEVGASRTALRKAWRSHRLDLEALLDQPKLAPDEYAAFVLAVIEKEALQEPVSHLIDFFDSLYVCQERAICDAQTSTALLGRDAHAFFTLHYPFIDRERKSGSNPEFARSLELFAKSSQ